MIQALREMCSRNHHRHINQWRPRRITSMIDFSDVCILMRYELIPFDITGFLHIMLLDQYQCVCGDSFNSEVIMK